MYKLSKVIMCGKNNVVDRSCTQITCLEVIIINKFYDQDLGRLYAHVVNPLCLTNRIILIIKLTIMEPHRINIFIFRDFRLCTSPTR